MDFTLGLILGFILGAIVGGTLIGIAGYRVWRNERQGR